MGCWRVVGVESVYSRALKVALLRHALAALLCVECRTSDAGQQWQTRWVDRVPIHASHAVGSLSCAAIACLRPLCVYVCACVLCCRPNAKAKAATEEPVLSASAAGLMAAVAETLAKLLMHQRAWLRHYPQHLLPANAAGQPSSTGEPHGSAAGAAAAQPVQLPPDSQQAQARLLQSALALLLQLQFHPATASRTEVCQRLSVFFDVFSAASEANQLQLAAACLPAARQALHLKTKRHPAPLLAKYVLQLLQQARLRQEQQATAGDNSKPTRSGRRAWCGDPRG